MNRTTSGLSSFRKYVGYSFRLVIFFSANSIRATFGSIVRVSTGVPSFRKVVYPKCVETHRRDTNATRVQEPRVFQENIKVVSKNGTEQGTSIPISLNFISDREFPQKGLILLLVWLSRMKLWMWNIWFFIFFFSYSRKFPLRIYRSKIRFRIIYNAWENRAFFDAILFDSWNFWNLLTSIFFPSTIFYLDRIFAIDMTDRMIRIYKR